jgi:hypothetical protein
MGVTYSELKDGPYKAKPCGPNTIRRRVTRKVISKLLQQFGNAQPQCLF